MKKEEDAGMVNFGSSKKAQAAMEFLMTYGWAILVVLVVIGALAYFGVLSPATLLPEKCTFPVSISCTDHTVTSTYIALVLQNGAGRDMTIRGVFGSSEAFSATRGCGTNATGPIDNTFTCPSSTGLGVVGCTGGATLRNGGSTTITLLNPAASCAFADTGRDKARYLISVHYSWLDSPSIVHQLPGELLGRRP